MVTTLADGFLPVVVPQLIRPTPALPDVPTPTDYAVDFSRGDLVITPSGRSVMQDARHAWAQWCIKCVLTERGVYRIYSTDYGVDMRAAFAEPSRPSIEVAVARTITEALMVNPQTVGVGSFAFEWVAENLYVSFLVTPHPNLGGPIRINFPPGSGVA